MSNRGAFVGIVKEEYHPTNDLTFSDYTSTAFDLYETTTSAGLGISTAGTNYASWTTLKSGYLELTESDYTNFNGKEYYDIPGTQVISPIVLS